MRVLADLHHFDLYHSLELLFGKRLGFGVCRPIGMDWYPEYWAISSDKQLAKLLLSTEPRYCFDWLHSRRTLIGLDWAVMSLHLTRIGRVEADPLQPGRYRVHDMSKHSWQDAITLEFFKNNQFDLLISSVPQHFPLFEKLRQKYQPQAKHIFYASAIGQKLPEGVKNVILNSPQEDTIPGINHVYCRQEFDLGTFYPAGMPDRAATRLVKSYVHFPVTEQIWQRIGLPDWTLRFIGRTLGPLNEVVVESSTIRDHMAVSSFTMHVKPGGESFGHILHNSFAVGRPVIINGNDFIGTQGGELLTSKTCLDVDRLSPEEVRKRLMETLEEPEQYREMQEACLARFKEVVDFDEDEKNIRQFLQDL